MVSSKKGGTPSLLVERGKVDRLDEHITLKHLLVAKEAFLSLTEGNSESKDPVLVTPDIIWFLSWLTQHFVWTLKEETIDTFSKK